MLMDDIRICSFICEKGEVPNNYKVAQERTQPIAFASRRDRFYERSPPLEIFHRAGEEVQRLFHVVPTFRAAIFYPQQS